jgi:membrane protein DedA with SNARE-associated domain
LSTQYQGVVLHGRCEFELRVSVTTVVLIAALAAPARGGPVVDGESPPPEAHVERAVRLMADLRPVSLESAAHIQAAYAGEVRTLALRNRQALAAAHDAGHVLPVSALRSASNLRLRLGGKHPIGELDRVHQDLYVAARPETIGCLLHVAARVRSGAVEVTSLVRHAAYQRALAGLNANARTQVPTHVMGLAFDISILHASPDTAVEIREVLEHMQANGDLLFVAEQRQLVFHVVPAPRRRGYYAAFSDAMTLVSPPPFDGPGLTIRDLSLAPPEPPAPPDRLEPLPPAQYAALGGWLVLAGLGVPPGEDLLLAGAAGLVGLGLLGWWPLVLLAAVSVVASDAILFWTGRTAAGFTKRPRTIPARAIARLDAIVNRWGALTIAAARFVPGSRAIVFASVGARGIRPGTFLLIDTCAAIAWVALVVSLGSWVLSVFLGGQPVLPGWMEVLRA